MGGGGTFEPRETILQIFTFVRETECELARSGRSHEATPPAPPPPPNLYNGLHDKTTGWLLTRVRQRRRI